MKSVKAEVNDIVQVVCDDMGLFTDEIDLDVVAGDSKTLKSCLSILEETKWPKGISLVSYRLVRKTLYCSVDHYEVGDERFNSLDEARAYAAQWLDVNGDDFKIYRVAVFKNLVEEDAGKL